MGRGPQHCPPTPGETCTRRLESGSGRTSWGLQHGGTLRARSLSRRGGSPSTASQERGPHLPTPPQSCLWSHLTHRACSAKRLLPAQLEAMDPEATRAAVCSGMGKRARPQRAPSSPAGRPEQDGTGRAQPQATARPHFHAQPAEGERPPPTTAPPIRGQGGGREGGPVGRRSLGGSVGGDRGWGRGLGDGECSGRGPGGEGGA